MNVLGRVGRSQNIELVYADLNFDQWDSPMFILGGSWKSTRAFETCNPHFHFRNGFILGPTSETFSPRSNDNDMGLLQKMKNPATGHPVWLAMGLRGAGTNAATYALIRWWKELGNLYGTKTFGLLLEMNDRDGWQQSLIIRLHPLPKWYRRYLHPLAWRNN